MPRACGRDGDERNDRDGRRDRDVVKPEYSSRMILFGRFFATFPGRSNREQIYFDGRGVFGDLIDKTFVKRQQFRISRSRQLFGQRDVEAVR